MVEEGVGAAGEAHHQAVPGGELVREQGREQTGSRVAPADGRRELRHPGLGGEGLRGLPGGAGRWRSK